MNFPNQNRANILVVDDTPENLRMMVQLLSELYGNVRPTTSGKAALIAVAKKLPDLILLDARMPEMDGYEVCRRLKQQAESKDIPVIFISSLDETEDKVKAFQAGGVDYVTKPFQIDEVLARVSAHLQIHRLQQALVGQNEQLEKMVDKRTQQLSEANSKLSVLSEAKSDFLNLISHELRTPLNGLLGAMDLALAEIENHTLAADLKGIYEASRQRLLALLENALLLSQMQVQSGHFSSNTSSLDDVLQAACQEATNLADPHVVKLTQIPSGLGQVVGDWVFLNKALLCLIETVVKFAKPGEEIQIQGHPFATGVCLVMECRGHSLPEAELPHFFEALSVSKTLKQGGDLGLAPSVAARIISLLGGRIQIRNRQPCGIQLEAWLARRIGPDPRLHLG